jgi:hypothetical protein
VVRAASVFKRLRPREAWPVGGELDAVAVGVREVDGLVGAVVGGALDRGPLRREPCRGRQFVEHWATREDLPAMLQPGILQPPGRPPS